MKLLLIFLCSIITILSFAEISITPKTHDFGKFPANQEQTYTFTIKNSGDETIDLGRIRSGCPCTKSTLSTKKLAKNESAKLSITIDANSQENDFKQTFYLETSSKKRRFLQFILTGNAEPILKINPIIDKKEKEEENKEQKYQITPTQKDVTFKVIPPQKELSYTLTKEKAYWLLTIPNQKDNWKIKILTPKNWNDITIKPPPRQKTASNNAQKT